MRFRESISKRPFFFFYISLPGWFPVPLRLSSVSTHGAASQATVSLQQLPLSQVNKSLVLHIWISDREQRSSTITIKGEDDSLVGTNNFNFSSWALSIAGGSAGEMLVFTPHSLHQLINQARVFSVTSSFGITDPLLVWSLHITKLFYK